MIWDHRVKKTRNDTQKTHKAQKMFLSKNRLLFCASRILSGLIQPSSTCRTHHHPERSVAWRQSFSLAALVIRPSLTGLVVGLSGARYAHWHEHCCHVSR